MLGRWPRCQGHRLLSIEYPERVEGSRQELVTVLAVGCLEPRRGLLGQLLMLRDTRRGRFQYIGSYWGYVVVGPDSCISHKILEEQGEEGGKERAITNLDDI